MARVCKGASRVLNKRSARRHTVDGLMQDLEMGCSPTLSNARINISVISTATVNLCPENICTEQVASSLSHVPPCQAATLLLSMASTRQPHDKQMPSSPTLLDSAIGEAGYVS